MIVHSEVDGDKRRLERLHVTRGTAQASLSCVAAPADVAKRQLPLRETRQRIGFDDGGVEALFGNAVAEQHDPVAIVDGKLSRRGGQRNYVGDGSGKSCADDECAGFLRDRYVIHLSCYCIVCLICMRG